MLIVQETGCVPGSVWTGGKFLPHRDLIPDRPARSTWMSVSGECCAFSRRGLCFGLITRPEEFYQVWCDREITTVKRHWASSGCGTVGKKNHFLG